MSRIFRRIFIGILSGALAATTLTATLHNGSGVEANIWGTPEPQIEKAQSLRARTEGPAIRRTAR
jgi:hypothetical protein